MRLKGLNARVLLEGVCKVMLSEGRDVPLSEEMAVWIQEIADGVSTYQRQKHQLEVQNARLKTIISEREQRIEELELPLVFVGCLRGEQVFASPEARGAIKALQDRIAMLQSFATRKGVGPERALEQIRNLVGE